MDKLKPIKRITSNDERTKPKLVPIKTSTNQKPTLSIRNKSIHDLASKLVTQSSFVSQQSSISLDQSSGEVYEIEQLYIQGNICNLRSIDDLIKKKYGIGHGIVFDVQNYIVIFAGRHQVQFCNGIPICLYVPPIFKSVCDPQTNKIQVLIQRKMKDNQMDPMQYPYIIIDPHNSLYPTYICSWIECKRKITLEHYIQYEQQPNQFMALGNAIHRYLEWLMRDQIQPEIPTQNQIRNLYESFIYEMYLLSMSFQTFYARVQVGICNLVQWYRRYVINKQLIQLNKWQRKYMRIKRKLGSQVMVKSKYFGIRGKVDGLFQGEYFDQKLNHHYLVSVPFQLKTGKKVIDSHKKQIDFYNLLLRQSRLMPVMGLLYYSEFNHLEYRVENPMICFENINIHRNKIVMNILKLYSNPLVINLPQLPQTFERCRLCDVSVECAVTRLQPQSIIDIQNAPDTTPQGYNVQIRERLKSLSVLDVAYLKKWTLWLHLQETTQKNINEENRKKSFYNKLRMSISELTKFRDYEQGNIIRLQLTKKIESHQMSQQTATYFKVGEKLRIFIPLIKVADCCRIASSNQTTKRFQMQIQIKSSNIKFNKNKCLFLLDQQEYKHIDVELQKYQNSFYNYSRGYCYKFVAEAEPWLKQIVIQETYKEEHIKMEQKISDQEPELKTLNKDQQKAFKKCIQNQRFCLVEGMPGTGKTQLILKLIQYYDRMGKTILVTSFTNQALSNILDRQLNKQKKIPVQHIIREGSRFGISSQYEHLSSQSQSQHQKSIQDYKNYFDSKNIWFVTISSLYIHHLPKKFDIVIVDQASQCLQASCLQALLRGNKFILIGDQKQLQPVVKSSQAIKRGMQISLFQRLCQKYGQFKTKLKKQYRMNPSIMNLTNKLVYDGQLQLADPTSMMSRTLSVPENWQQIIPQFLHPVMDPAKSLRFINYDSALNLIGASDLLGLKKIKRFLQLRIACCLYKQFRNLAIQRQNILIISAYNSLVHQLVRSLKQQNLIESNNSDVLTIDKSQGTDKDIIIFIFHQGNKELIQNFRRLNVALTRAKNKFIIVGSHKQLSQLATWTGRLAELLIPDQVNVQKQFLQGLLQGYTQIDLT